MSCACQGDAFVYFDELFFLFPGDFYVFFLCGFVFFSGDQFGRRAFSFWILGRWPHVGMQESSLLGVMLARVSKAMHVPVIRNKSLVLPF